MERGSLASRITTAPVPFDRDRADAVMAGLAGELQSGAIGALLLGTAGSSAYLGRLIERQGGWLTEIAGAAPEQTMRGLLDVLGAEATDSRALGALLRQVKSRAALVIALADLGGVWDLAQVTGALTDLADGALQAACGWLLRA
ncbi:MAG: glutamine-synthetase adenylyltransferase, partial [Thermohalobaculum sp.]